VTKPAHPLSAHCATSLRGNDYGPVWQRSLLVAAGLRKSVIWMFSPAAGLGITHARWPLVYLPEHDVSVVTIGRSYHDRTRWVHW